MFLIEDFLFFSVFVSQSLGVGEGGATRFEKEIFEKMTFHTKKHTVISVYHSIWAYAELFSVHIYIYNYIY